MRQVESVEVAATGWRFAASPVAGAHTRAAATPLSGGLVCGMLLASLGDGGYLIAARRELAAGLAAAALVELAFRERVDADGQRLLVSDSSPTGDAVVDPVLASLATRRRAPDAERCLEDLSLDWTILGRAGQALEARGVVRIERRALHPLIMHRFHALPADRPATLRAELRSIVEGARPGATVRDLALATLAAAAGLLRAGRGSSAAHETVAEEAGSGAGQAGRVLLALRPALVQTGGGRRESTAAIALASA